MDKATFEREDALHRRFWEENRERIRRDYGGQWVAIANGQLIGTGPTYRDAWAALEQLFPVPEYYLVLPANEEPIWDVVEG
jgi:hypothetical protein